MWPLTAVAGALSSFRAEQEEPGDDDFEAQLQQAQPQRSNSVTRQPMGSYIERMRLTSA